MTSCSPTAPRWSEEDEQREIDALSEEERQQVFEDLFGRSIQSTVHFTVDGDDDTEEHLDQLKQALHSMSQSSPTTTSQPCNKKLDPSAYWEATRCCPRLAIEEVRPLLFLHHEAFNTTAAASRLVQYWALRKSLFSERAFSPMTIVNIQRSGGDGGALTDAEWALLRMGTFQLLPDDNHGRTVLFTHKALFAPSHHPEGHNSLLRCWFYMLTVAMQRESTQKNGLVLVCNLKVCVQKHACAVKSGP
jgi:hypothetical protein